MSNIFKYAAFILILMIIITLGVLYYSGDKNTNSKDSYANKGNDIESTSSQYKIYFNFDGEKTQIIDFIKGNTELNLLYKGTSKFTARLLYTDGTVLAILADMNGPVNEKQTITVPKTGPYLLDVMTTGEWSFNRE